MGEGASPSRSTEIHGEEGSIAKDKYTHARTHTHICMLQYNIRNQLYNSSASEEKFSQGISDPRGEGVL